MKQQFYISRVKEKKVENNIESRSSKSRVKAVKTRPNSSPVVSMNDWR